MNDFQSTARQIESLLNNPISINQLPSTNREIQTSDISSTPAVHEDINQNGPDKYRATQYKFELIDETNKTHAKVSYTVFDSAEQPIALIDWLEVCNHDLWGNDLGSTLHEELVNHIIANTQSTKIYTQLENDRLQSALLETGFQQLDIGGKNPWYVLPL